MSPQRDSVECWSCTHDVDDHDVLARCLDPACACGWEPRPTGRHEGRRV